MEFLECLIDVGSFRGHLCLVLRCLFEMLESLSKNTTASWKAPCLVQKSVPFVTASTSFSLKETFSRKNAWKPLVYTLSGSFLCKFRDDCQKNLNLLKKKKKKEKVVEIKASEPRSRCNVG